MISRGLVLAKSSNCFSPYCEGRRSLLVHRSPLLTVWHMSLVLALALMLKPQVLGINCDLGDQYHKCCCPADTRPFDTRSPQEAVNDFINYRSRFEMYALNCARRVAVHEMFEMLMWIKKRHFASFHPLAVFSERQ